MSEHPRFVVGDDHHPKQLKVLDPETARLSEWRRVYDEQRQIAFEVRQGCGRCIGGVVYFGPAESDHASCNCPWVRKDQ